MAAEDEVEARNLDGYRDGAVLVLLRIEVIAIDMIVSARVAETDQNVRLLFLLDDRNPMLGTFNHILEFEMRPKFLGEPSGNVRCNHTEHSHFDARTCEDAIGGEHRFSGAFVDGIGTKPLFAKLFGYTFVIHLFARFHIVVAQADGVVPHVIIHEGDEVRRYGIDEIVVVHGGLSLQAVTCVEKEYGIGVFHTLLVDVGADVGH